MHNEVDQVLFSFVNLVLRVCVSWLENLLVAWPGSIVLGRRSGQWSWYLNEECSTPEQLSSQQTAELSPFWVKVSRGSVTAARPGVPYSTKRQLMCRSLTVCVLRLVLSVE